MATEAPNLTRPDSPSYPNIEDYAFIGDCRSAALVSKSGCIDWLCWPRFDSPSVFAALLDRERGGYLEHPPEGSAFLKCQKREESNPLQTTLPSRLGTRRLLHLMPGSRTTL